ncbi:bifunctional phosphoribosyl-AMP cyclohydrolase/phosphoribosyl-ATP diphosphatase HisIE [soil metagenome]
MRIADTAALDTLDFDKADGLLPVIAQHARTGEVLMLAYANREAIARTLADGVMWYHSRSRGEQWRKGATSGNVQQLVSLHADCDRDTLIAHVLPAGPSCHTGSWSCFDAAPSLAALDALIASRAAQPAGTSYTQRLLGDVNLRLKKLGEEAVELALACERQETDRVAEEAADLLYHALVACRAVGVSAADVMASLDARRPVSPAGAAAAAAAAGTAPEG